MTKGDAKKQFLRWLDEATINGQEAGRDLTADLEDRFGYMLDGTVKYLAGIFKLPAVMKAVQSPEKNLLGESFSQTRIAPPDVFSASAPGAKSWYVEIAGPAVLQAGEKRIECPDAGGFVPYRGNLQGGESLRIAGGYPFFVRYAALYGSAFASDERVPPFSPWVYYELPDNFREFDTIVCINGEERRTLSDFCREGLRGFSVPRRTEGELWFQYYKNPADVPPDAPNETVLEVREEAAALVPLKVAVDALAGTDETASISQYLNGLFNNMLMNALTHETGRKKQIQMIYRQV